MAGLVAALLALSAHAQTATPSVVQYTTYQTSGMNGELNSSVAFTTPTQAGDTIWVAVTISDYATIHTLSVTDTQGNAYTLLEQENDGAPGSQTVAHFYAANIVGDTTTPDVVTLSSTYDDYRGLLVAEIAGTTAAPLIGSAANIQDALAAGTNNVTSGPIGIAAGQTPALLVAVSMNTTGGASDMGGSGAGGPAAGTGLTQVTQMWNWGVNLATFATGTVSSPGSVAALFNAPDTDSYVTVAAAFLPSTTGAPPTVSLAANPTSIVAGTSSTLTWSSSNATACTASGGWSGSEPLSGSLAVSPATTTTYTLTCTGPNGMTAPASALVTVTAAPPTATLTATPTLIAAGQLTTLTWSSTGAASCTASGAWSGAEPAAGSASVAPAVNSTYTLTCANTAGAMAASTVTVQVIPPPPVGGPGCAGRCPPVTPTTILSASPALIAAGGSSTLTWSSTNATACTATGAWNGSESPAGTLSVSPASTSTYTLVCGTNGLNSAPVSATVSVPPPPPTVTVSATPASILAGSTTTLVWSSTNATTCTAAGAWSGNETPSGTLTVTPAVTSTYTLTCYNAGGSSSPQSTTVTVGTAPVPALVQYATYQTQNTAGENNSKVSFTQPTKAGDTIWVAATVPDYGGLHTISVKDSQGNKYTQLDQKNDYAPGYQSVAHFYAANIVGDTGTPDTITVVWTYDNYKGVVVAEISGTTTTPLIGHTANIQDGLAAGTNNVTAPPIGVIAAQTPALVLALSMNTSGGSSDLGGSGFGGPAPGTGYTQVAQFWNWGMPLATFATSTLTTGGSVAPLFNAPDTDSYVTEAAVFQ